MTATTATDETTPRSFAGPPRRQAPVPESPRSGAGAAYFAAIADPGASCR